MNEVSCRAFQLARTSSEKFGIPLEMLTRGVHRDLEYLGNPRNRIDWDEWILMAQNAWDASGSFERFSEMNSYWGFDSDGLNLFRKSAGFVLSVESLYVRFLPTMLRSVYRNLSIECRQLEPHVFELTVKIPETDSDSQSFLLSGIGAFKNTSRFIGLPPSRVEQTVTVRRGVYRIYTPESRTLWHRCSALGRGLVASFSFLRILREQNAELTASYAQLEQQTTNLRNVLAASSDGIAVVREGRLLHANPALAQLLRAASADALIGQSTDLWVDPADLAQLRAWADLHPPETERRELRLKVSTGEAVHVELAAPRPITWENQPATLWLLRDISERRALETAVATARQREQASLARDLHDGLGQYLTGLAFKLKALETRLTRAGSSEAAAAAEMVDIANHATTQARDIAHGLAPVDLDPQGLIPALRLLCANVSHLFQLACTLAAPEEPLALPRATANQLYRAAQEAITNAHRHGRAKRIELHLTLPGADQLILTIDDHGAGLPADTATRHAGLGLKIMRHRLTSIGGHFQIEKAPTSSGARVTLTAPIFAASATPLPASPDFHDAPPTPPAAPSDLPTLDPLPSLPSLDSPPSTLRSPFRLQPSTVNLSVSTAVSRRLRVLLADDHAIVRTGLTQMLGQTGDFVTCAEASDPGEAESLCALHRPDLLITDMLFGETTALESIRRLRATHPALRIVVLSMYSPELYADAAREAGADAYVTKQSSPDELLATLRAVTA